MNFDKTLFRCSSLGHLMTDPQSKAAKESGELSETAKTHLIDVYVSNKYGRQTDIHNKYIEKGLAVEESSITLYSRVTKRFFKKNDQPITNEFIKGTPDIFTGLKVTQADEVIDIKSSWDIYTFFRVHTTATNKLYFWQLQGYMALTGAKSATLAYCLVNTPDVLIADEKRKLGWKMGALTEETPEFQQACIEIEKAMLFDDIPMKERVIEITVERDDAAIERIYERVEKARTYLNTLEQRLNPSVLVATLDKSVNVLIVE